MYKNLRMNFFATLHKSTFRKTRKFIISNKTFKCFTKFSISRDRLFLKKFIIKSNVVENVCFRVLVKWFSETLNFSISFGLQISLFKISKINTGVFFHKTK